MSKGISDIMGAGGADTTSLSELLRQQLQEAQEEMTDSLSGLDSKVKDLSSLASDTAETLSSASDGDSFGPAYRTNLMGNNFVDADSGESRYLKAAKQARTISAQYKNAYDSEAFAALQQYGGISVSGTYYPNPNAPSKAEIEANQKRERDTVLMEKAQQDARAQREREAQALKEAALGGEGAATEAPAVQAAPAPAPVAEPVSVPAAAPVSTTPAVAVEAAAPTPAAAKAPTVNIAV